MKTNKQGVVGTSARAAQSDKPRTYRIQYAKHNASSVCYKSDKDPQISFRYIMLTKIDYRQTQGQTK